MSKEMDVLFESARGAMALAKKLGASDASVYASRSRDVETRWRDGKLEKIAEATSRSVSIGLYVDGRYGSMSTSDLRPEALGSFVENAVAIVRTLARDPHRRLPDPKLYAGRIDADLEMYDPAVSGLTADGRLLRAKAMEEGARSVKSADRIASVTTTVSNEVEVSVKDADGRRPEDWASPTVRFVGDLPEPASVGREAAERALGAKNGASGVMPVLVEARSARSLLRHLPAPLGGGALQQKESFFEGKLGKVVASSVLTLTDEPHLRRGLASRPYDGEGMATKPRVLIEGGALKSYFIDVYYGSKLGMPRRRACSRSASAAFAS